MRRARTRTGRISVLAKCSSVVLLLLLISSPSYALSVSGVPVWLEGAVVRSLNAVWAEIPDSPEIDREGTLELVAGRLFAGYDVKVKSLRDEPAVILSAHDEPVAPSIRINLPELRAMALSWFSADIAGLSEDIAELAAGLPQSAYTWADEALRDELGRHVKNRLPGWEFTQQIYIASGSTLISLSFRPSSSMVLAVKPSMYSRTIPAMFRSDLEAKLIPELSPLIGLPVKWAEKHKQDIEKVSREYLEDRHSVENLRANVNIKFRAGTVSELDVQADSEDFMFQLWVAAYAGLEGRYPEAGVFFGFRPHAKFSPEIYGEMMFSLDDFGAIRRLGIRFEPVSNLFAGVEYQWPEEGYFLRLHYMPVKVRRPYAWWRWSPELEAHEAAVGYRMDEHVSVEIYYDSTGSDKIGIRGMWHL